MGCPQSMLAFTWNSHHAGLVWATIFLRIHEYNLLGTLTNELSRRIYSESHFSKLIQAKDKLAYIITQSLYFNESRQHLY